MRTLEQLRREGSMALWHDYELGHANDLSGNGNDGTLVGAARLGRSGLETVYLGSGAVQVPHSASINLSTFAFVGLVRTKLIGKESSILPQLARKHDATGFSWSARIPDNNNSIQIDANVATSSWSMSSRNTGYSMFSGNIISGSTATSGYRDGLVEDTSLDVAPIINLNASDLFIGNYYLLTRGFGSPISSFLLFNRVLTSSEHAQVYGELMKTRRGVLS